MLDGSETGLTLYDDQQQVKALLYNQIRLGKKRVMVKAPTGFGKTALAASIVLDAREKGVPVLFIAPMITLIDQTISEFWQFGVKDIGAIQADHYLTDYSKQVQICSVQTIAQLVKKNPVAWQDYQKDKLIIIDEAHLWFDTHEKIMSAATKPLIGLSATPWRKGLGKYYDGLVNGPSVGWLIENDRLSSYKAYSHHVPDLKGVKTSNGDYSAKETGEQYEPKLIGDIVSTWKNLGEDKKTILFAPRVVDAERFAKEFNLSGVPSVAVSGYMENEDCAKEIERFRNGEIKVLCSVTKLATGFNVKDVGCMIDAQPTKSLMRHSQKIGRVLRTAPGKDYAIILDNAGNLLRNGLPCGDFPEELCNGEKGESTDRRKNDEPLPKVCPKCNAMKPPRVAKCPACNFETKKQSEIQSEAGELVEIAGKRMTKEEAWNYKIEFMQGLNWICRKNAYHEKWAHHQFEKRFGHKPNHSEILQCGDFPASQEIKNWVKSQQIRYSKGIAKWGKK